MNTVAIFIIGLVVLFSSFINIHHTTQIKDLHNRVKALEAVCKNLNIPIPKVEKD